MKIKLKEYDQKNEEFLKRMMIDAYDDDAILHTGGEYFNNNADCFFNQLLNEEYEFKEIIDEEKNKVIGAICLDMQKEEIISFFIDPLLHNYGYGKCALEKVIKEKKKIFKVSIPCYSKRLYHFFNKCGFVVIKEEYYDEFVILEYVS